MDSEHDHHLCTDVRPHVVIGGVVALVTRPMAKHHVERVARGKRSRCAISRADGGPTFQS